MIFISHRGNINGRIPERENTVAYVEEALAQGFHVEVDLWIFGDKIFLGHDSPEEQIQEVWLLDNHEKLWLHAKSEQTAEILYRRNSEFHWFWHQEDTMTLTNRGFLWTYPGSVLENCVTVQPNFVPLPNTILGVCSDELQKFYNFYVNPRHLD